MTKTSLALPDELFGLLAAADKQRHFPPGTMQSLLMQETGGQAKYLTDPTSPHYVADANGRRKSSAYGPFGILESTAKDPGYGVAPMGDSTNLAEHVRFAADYLDARSKSAGSLQAGLAGYGEGEKYSRQVMRRIPNSVGNPVPGPVEVVAPVVTPATPIPVDPVIQPQVDPWQTYLAALSANQAPVKPVDLAYGQPQVVVAPQIAPPDFMASLAMLGQGPSANFKPFTVMKARV